MAKPSQKTDPSALDPLGDETSSEDPNLDRATDPSENLASAPASPFGDWPSVQSIQDEKTLTGIAEPPPPDLTSTSIAEDSLKEKTFVPSKKIYALEKEKQSIQLSEQLAYYEQEYIKIKSLFDLEVEKNNHLIEKLGFQNAVVEKIKQEADRKEQQLKDDIENIKRDFQDKMLIHEQQNALFKNFQKEKEEWKKNIKEELNKIKLKEKEIENKYELLKNDTQALIDSKDKQILDMRKKCDALELELETFEDKLRTALNKQQIMISKKKRLIETFKLATRLLENMEEAEDVDLESALSGNSDRS